MKKSLDFLDLSSKEIHIHFVSDYRMKNKSPSNLEILQTTDVLSFLYDDDYDKIYGELFISFKYCKKNIKKNKNTIIKELSILCIHGFLHLLGYDHDNPEREKRCFNYKKRFIVNLFSPYISPS